MLESRAAYGYYGEGYGASGETKQSDHKGGNFQYEWWDVDIHFRVGKSTLEIKAKNKENAIKQIKKYAKENERFIVEIYWDTLRLDRVGYQRLS